MSRQFHVRLANRGIFAILLAGFATPAWGQDPFGGDPFGTGTFAPGAAASAAAGAEAAAAEEQEPLLQSIESLTNSDAPADLTRAVQILMDYGKLDEAKKYLEKLVGLKLDEAALVDLHNEFRSGLFFRMAGTRELQPEGAAFGDAVLSAARAAARDDGRLAALIEQLSAAEPALRRQALVDLRDADYEGVNALLKVMADPARAAEHAVARAALVALLQPAPGIESRDGGLTKLLVVATETADDALRSQLFSVLGSLDALAAVPMLVRPAVIEPTTDAGIAARKALLQIVGRVPERWEAELYLQRDARAALAGNPVGDVDEQGRAQVWQWDDATKTGRPLSLLASDASLLVAARLAGELHRLALDDPAFQQLYLLTRLHTDKTLAGLDQPLPQGAGTAHDEAVAAGPQVVEAVLEDAVAQDLTAAAIAAIEVLGETGDERLLQCADGRPRRLARSLRHPDRRVRFAATEAIRAIDPQFPFPGSSFLPEALAYFASSHGSRRVLIAHPRIDHGQTLAGMAAEFGFEADTAQTGRQALLLAQQNPDYEFVLVSDAISRPAVSEFLQQLRRDPLSSRLPVGLMARRENFLSMERVADGDRLTEVFPRPHSASVMTEQVARLLTRAGRDATGYDERMSQATAALEHLAHLAANERTYGFYDLFRHQDAIERALETPALAAEAARVLGALGSPSAQQALVTMASQHARPLANRQAAAEAFAEAIQRRGLLLTRSEILTQYDRYNTSRNLDPETQQLLASLLDAIEAPSRSASSASSHGPPVQDEP